MRVAKKGETTQKSKLPIQNSNANGTTMAEKEELSCTPTCLDQYQNSTGRLQQSPNIRSNRTSHPAERKATVTPKPTKENMNAFKKAMRIRSQDS